MSAQRIGIVWNPSKTSREELEAALRAAEQRGGPAPTVDWFETSEDDPGRSAARSAVEAGADVVIAAGGDGTVRAVAELLAAEKPDAELGILPLGTGNLLARNLGVPLDDAEAAFERALRETGRAIDIGWAEVTGEDGTERHAFAVMAGFGIDAHMIAETDDDLKSRVGWLAYVESLGRALSASEVIRLRLSVDGEDAEVAAHTLIVGNCGTLQGGATLLPDADPSDGELDLLLLGAEGVAGWLDTLRNMAWDNGLKRLLRLSDDDAGAQSSETTRHGRLTTLSVELDEARTFEVDGDDIGEVTRVEITIQPAAVRVR